MKVLLIQAGMSGERRPYDVVERGQLMMPIGLGYLGAVLKDRGVEVRVKDYLAQKFEEKDFLKELDSFRPDLIGISSLTSTYKQAMRIVYLIKKAAATPIVMGGIHVSFLPEEALKNSNVDFVIRGEGEETISELIEWMDGRVPLSSISGLSYRDNGKIVHNSDREDIQDLDVLPYPDWSIFEHRLYESPLTGEINVPVNFGRGCPYFCSFCSVGGKKRRERKAEAVLEEFKWMVEKYGFRNFIVTDDIHLINGEFKRIIEFLVKENIGISWKMTNRLDNIDKELLFKMKEAGCQAIGYGIESPNQSTLKMVHKNFSLSSLIDVIQWTRQAGISVAASFMFGFPWERREDIKDTIRFSATLPIYSVCYNLVTYFPGTEMFKQIIDEGKATLEDINWNDFTLHKATFPTPYLSKAELDSFLEKAYDYFYFRKVREDLHRFVRHIGKILKRDEISYKDIRHTFPAIVKAGSFYYGEVLKQKGLWSKIRYILRICRYLIILPEL